MKKISDIINLTKKILKWNEYLATNDGEDLKKIKTLMEKL